MLFCIMSRESAMKYTVEGPDRNCVIISISDPGTEPTRFPHSPNIKAILSLCFADTDNDSHDAMQKSDADRILSFVRAWKNGVDEIIVHCGAGVSRSAGVCAALMLWLNGSDKGVFSNPYYRPNMRCYRMVLNALMEEAIL